MRRITILLAAMAALMLVPAAQAFANHTLTVNVEGTGAGEVSSVGGWEENGGIFEGTTPIECSYEFPFAPEGNCEEEMEELEPGFEGIYLHPIPAEGSEFAGWTVEAGSPTYGELFGLCEYGEGNNGCLVTSEKPGEPGEYEDGVGHRSLQRRSSPHRTTPNRQNQQRLGHRGLQPRRDRMHRRGADHLRRRIRRRL